jgi:glycosyltransferase involved in cell wall biosynthesis
MNSPIGYTGYGVVGWHITKYLHQNNIDTTVFPITIQRFEKPPQLDSQEDNELLHQLINKPFNSSSPCIKIWHQFDLAERIGTGKYLAFPFFEVDKFNERELIHLNIPDELIVSSQWAKDVVLSNGINKPIHIVSLGVDSDIFDPSLSIKYSHKEDKDPYIFLAIGKWEIRKGHDILHEIFHKAFSSTDNVELWIAASSDKTCFSEKELLDWHTYYQTGALKDKIKIIPRLPTQHDIAEKIAQADCGVFLSRAEGWNLELLEMMSMNKPVITTNYSAHTEFCNSDNAYLVDIDDLEPAYDSKWFFGYGKWAKIGEKQKTQAADFMRHAFEQRIRTNTAGVKTGQQFSWNNTAMKVIECIL